MFKLLFFYKSKKYKIFQLFSPIWQIKPRKDKTKHLTGQTAWSDTSKIFHLDNHIKSFPQNKTDIYANRETFCSLELLEIVA